MDLMEVFKALSDETRLRLLNLLLQQGDLCVCEMVDALEIPQYQVSRHLRILRHVGLVKRERRGTWMYYRVNRGESACLDDLLGVIRRHFKERYAEDLRRLRERLSFRQDGLCVIGYSLYERARAGEPVEIEIQTKQGSNE